MTGPDIAPPRTTRTGLLHIQILTAALWYAVCGYVLFILVPYLALYTIPGKSICDDFCRAPVDQLPWLYNGPLTILTAVPYIIAMIGPCVWAALLVSAALAWSHARARGLRLPGTLSRLLTAATIAVAVCLALQFTPMGGTIQTWVLD